MAILDFTEVIQRGLRPDSRMPVGAPYLTTCTNMRPTPYGLKDFNAVVQPITAAELTALSITKSWPFPQLFRGKSVTLLFSATGVFTVTESPANDWQLTAITTYNAADMASASPATKAITTGGPWHFVDFYDTWMAFNGVSTVFKVGASSGVWTTDAVTISTGGDYKEARVFYAGFTSNMYALADWPTFLGTLDGTLIPTEFSSKTLLDDMGANWVWWSAIGGGDLLWLFNLAFMKYASLGTTPDTGFSSDRYYFQELWRRNEAGARPMPWQGTVYQVKQLGDVMMAYGTGGVSALVPGGDPATFGLRTPTGWGTRLGVASRSSAGGGPLGHLVVDEAGELWGIGPDLNCTRLGYKEWLSPMLANQIVVSFEEQLGEYYISDQTSCYIYSQNGGFAKAPYHPTTVHFADATPVGIITASSSPTTVDIRSEWFRGGAVGEITTLERVRLGTTDIESTGWSVYVEYRFKKGKAETSTAAVVANADGMALFNVPGLEFRWRITNPDKTKCDLESVSVDISSDGKTSTRQWLNASTPAAATV